MFSNTYMKVIFGVLIENMECNDYDNDSYFDEEPECILFCPYCLCIEENNCQYIDYVDKPMLWCGYDCARCVLDLPLDITNVEIKKLEKIGNINDLKIKHQELNYNNIKNNNYEFYYVNLLFIEKVINSKLAHYTVNETLDDNIIRDFIKSNYDKQMMKEYNIAKIKNICDDKINFNLSIDCNSYNAVKPSQPYPKNYDMGHDGPSIYLRCLDKDNKIIYVSYCGD